MMKIEQLYHLYSKYYIVDTDTRKIRKNSIFFALKGTSFNGNRFAETALERGAIYSIVDEKEYVTNEKIILVNNVLETLQKLANFHRNKIKTKIIALTGSNGKTTTKELFLSVLSSKYKTVATIGNLNNHIGVPLSLLSIKPDTEFGIIEMGANHLKEIEVLCNITEPDIGYISNFGKAHLEGFGSIEGVIQGKSELYNYLYLNNKIALVNPSDSIQVEKTQNIHRILFDSSVRLISSNPYITLEYNSTTFQSNLIGNYNYTNIAAAISLGKYLNVPDSQIIGAIASYTPKNNRSQIIKRRSNTIILDAYNANPSSMKAAIENFSQIQDTQKILILGDMFELGDASDVEHQKVSDIINQNNFNDVFLVGKHFYKTQNNFKKFRFFEDLKNSIQQKNTLKNSYLLIKGSRGMALERIVDCLE